jgi:hypothetical protein
MIFAYIFVTLIALAQGTTPTSYFDFTGAISSITIPSWCNSIRAYMWGAGGQSYGYGAGGVGGAAAYIEGLLAVTPGETLSVLVGQSGTPEGSFGGGGPAACCSGGGGRSAIRRDNEDVVTAGGGGGADGDTDGAGGSASSYCTDTIQLVSFQGGSVGSVRGGGIMSQACGGDGHHGGGGTQTMGGCSQNEVGSKYQGGSGWAEAGGGGGYYGGGGGHFGHGGGGGSSYMALLADFGLSQSALSNSGNCNGNHSRHYVATACGGADQNGRIAIEFLSSPSGQSTSAPSAPNAICPHGYHSVNHQCEKCHPDGY